MTIFATLCFVRRNRRILLIKKSRGFGSGKWNAPGGRMLLEESPKECAIREVREETGLTIGHLQYHGLLHFYVGGNEPEWTVHVFSTNSYQGKPSKGREGPVKWFEEKNIPYSEMWEDDAHWLPLVLSGKNFDGSFYFTEDWKRLLKHNLRTIPTQ